MKKASSRSNTVKKVVVGRSAVTEGRRDWELLGMLV